MAQKVKKHWREDFDIWASPVLANMLWLMFSVFVITVPLGIVGIIAVMFHWMDDRRTQVFSIFFSTIRQVWLKSYLLLILNVLVGGFLLFNLHIISQMPLTDPLAILSLGTTLVISVVFLSICVPAWVLVATWDAPLKSILIFSVQLVFAHPLWMVGSMIAFVSVFVVSLILPAAVFITVTGAIAAYIACWRTFTLVYKYNNNFQLIDIQ